MKCLSKVCVWKVRGFFCHGDFLKVTTEREL